MSIVISEYLNIFLKEGIPFFITQLVALFPYVVILIIFFNLKEPIVCFISRAQSFRFSGAEIIAQGNETSNKGLDTGQDSEHFSDKNKKIPIPDPLESDIFKDILLQRENTIKEEIKKSQYKTDEFLLKNLASCQIALNFERIYQSIFKSQFDALEMLNSNLEGVSRNELKTLYEQAKNNYPKAYINFSFENWFYFLTINDLVLQKQDKWYATDKSKAFVLYVIFQQRYNVQYKGL